MESVDYVDTFITVSPDSTADGAAAPPPRGEAPTVASATFELVTQHPYRWRSSDIIFTVWADRRDVPEAERERARAEFYARPQACLRSSELAKRYGWGIHSDHDGRVAIYAVGTPEYESLASGRAPDGRPVNVRPAMRSAHAVAV